MSYQRRIRSAYFESVSLWVTALKHVEIRPEVEFPSFMSEPYLSTRSKTSMHLKKFKNFSSLRRPETHFRHAQGYQRAGALTGSINIFQSTTFAVYEVEYQKTVDTKLGKQTIWFSEIIKDIYHYFQQKEAGRQKETAGKVALLSQSLSIDITKSYG